MASYRETTRVSSSSLWIYQTSNLEKKKIKHLKLTQVHLRRVSMVLSTNLCVCVCVCVCACVLECNILIRHHFPERDMKWNEIPNLCMPPGKFNTSFNTSCTSWVDFRNGMSVYIHVWIGEILCKCEWVYPVKVPGHDLFGPKVPNLMVFMEKLKTCRVGACTEVTQMPHSFSQGMPRGLIIFLTFCQALRLHIFCNHHSLPAFSSLV